jgi:copper resistance protein D
MAEALVAVRLVHFLAAMTAFGIGAFRLYGFAGVPVAVTEPLRAGLARTMTVCSVGALLSALAMVPCVAAGMAGSIAAGFDPGTWYAVLADTKFGDAWCWHLGFAVALVVLCLLPARGWCAGAQTAMALLLLGSLGWVGHAASDEGAGLGHIINQMTHLTAAGLWLGGLVPLAMLLHRASRSDGAAYAAAARVALPQFSRIGYAAVALVALTGAVNSIVLVGSFGGLARTPYGRLLALKIALFLAMVGLAVVNRFCLVPRLREAAAAQGALRSLYASVVAEQSLACLIIAIVALLGTWPPAIGMK